MHSKLHGNVVHHGAELLLLVSMLFLLAIPKSPLILEIFYTLVCTVFAYPKDYGYIRVILALTNTLSLNLLKIVQSIESSYATLDEADAVYRTVYQRNKIAALGYL